MDTRKIFTTALMFMAIFFAIQYFTRKDNNNGNNAGTQPAIAFTQPAAKPAASEAGAVPDKITLGDAWHKTSKDKVSITVDPVTAGLDRVELNINNYAQTVKKTEPFTLLQAVAGVPKPYSTLGVHITLGAAPEEVVETNLPADFPKFDPDPVKNQDRAQRIHDINSDLIFKTQYVWKEVNRVPAGAVNPTSVTLRLTIVNPLGKPVARIDKIFTIDPASYNVLISHNVTNLTDQPIKVAIDEMAATDLSRADVRVDDRIYMAGNLVSASKIIKTDRVLYSHTLLQKEATPTKSVGQMNDFANDPLLWIASSDRFFTAITRPLPETGAPAPLTLTSTEVIPQPRHIASSEVDELQKAAAPEDNIYGLKLTGAPVAVGAGGSSMLPLTAYLGPKDRNILSPSTVQKGTYAYDYRTFAYGDVIQFNSGGCYSYCSFALISTTLLTMLDWIAHHITFNNYGLAIFVLVILVRALLHPLTKRSQISMATMGQKMNAIKPKIEAVKKKYAGDKKREQEETMRLYRENDVNPAGGVMGCLPMLLQMPIWVAMYQGLWNDLDLRHAVFIPGWINDLAAPDALFSFAPFTIPFIGAKIATFNLLPILLGVVFFFQMKIQTASQPKPADEQQAQVQKYSQFMFLLFPIFLYNAPSGLNLYYFASTTAGLVDTYIVRKTLKKRGILPANAKTLPTEPEENTE